MFCPVCRSDYADDWKVCPKDAAVLLRSQYVGKYRIDQLLGAGGMGAVYKAYNPDTQSTVAVKLMHGGANANDASRQRFQREAASIAALRTRHVVSIYDFGADVDGTLYLVMEYLQGHPLRSEVAPMPHCIPLPRVNFLVDQSLRGLGPAHRAGIVHRDLKPENLFVADTDDGEVVKILDFGIARVQRGDTPNLTHSGALMGTPAYMAPEQVAGNRGQVGRHSDVYAFGVIIYEMLTGLSPFHAETISEVLSKILSREFAPLGQLRPDLPPALSQLVDRALADDPAARFGAADDMREAWGRAWSQLPVEIRNAPIPPFANKDAGGPIESAPGIGRNTDVPSAPTQLPARFMGTTPQTPQALAATAAADSMQQFPSVTPGPVVVETHVVKRGKGGLIALIAGVVVIGGGGAAFLATRGGSGSGTGTGTGTSAVITVDAAAKPVIAIDAAVGYAIAIDAAVAPPSIDAGPSDMVQFAGATFDMGDEPDDAGKFPGAQAKHPVTVAAFALDKTEVAGDDGLPVTGLSWDDADAACRALGKRLPTEAEWELASKASEIDPRHANLKEAHKKGPTKVGTMSGDCTDEGVCDLLGNVMEWTADKVVRGASYNTAAGGWYGTVHARLVTDGSGDKEIGFRCAK